MSTADTGSAARRPSVDRTDDEARRRELLRLLLAEEGLGRDGPTTTTPARGPDEPQPLSPAQRRMWFLQRLDPDGAAYNLCGGVELTGDLDRGRLAGALRELTTRHEILRTRYPLLAKDGTPTVCTVAPHDVDLPVIDLSGTDPDAAARARVVETAVGDLTRRPFDLAVDLPARYTLLRFAADDHLLVLVVHHIAFDDLSWGIVLDDLAELYAGGTRRPEPESRYADYAWQQHDALAEDRWAAQLDHWRTRLDPVPPLCALPGDLPATGAPDGSGRRTTRTLDPSTSAAVRDLARAEGCTPYMLLLAAVQSVLHRWSGSTDIAVGSPVVTRDRTALERVVGNFGNTLVLRTDLAGEPTFRELLHRVRDVCSDAFAHRDVPFDRLVEELRPRRGVQGAALVNVAFSHLSAPPRRIDLPGLALREVSLFNHTARFDLAIEAVDTLEGLRIGATARADRFSATALERALTHVLTLVSGAVADPDVRIGELPLLDAAQEHTLVREWSGTRTDPNVADPLHVLIERQAARTPDAVAVVFEGETLDYAGLDARADTLAAVLRASGVGPEAIVGVYLERSAGLIVTLLAVLKAGGAFVPIEPAWPARRVAEIVESAGVTAIVTQPRVRGGLPDVGAAVIEVDDLGGPIDASPEPVTERVAVPVDQENLAYVIHTSGSSGTPKGAMIRHQAICDRLVWQSALLALSADDVVLHKAPLGFDISVNEIFLPLVAGARLVVASPGTDGDVDYLLRVIERERVTFVYLVASMLDVLLERADAAVGLRSLRHLWCGGEALTGDLYRRFRAVSDATVLHGYGPAEATIGVSCRVFDADAPGGVITIGRPNPNTRLYLLDPYQRPVPPGVPGELYIGGTPLARGYLGDPRRTADRFVPDPFGPAGGRLYRTGDLARFLSDGQIEFLGRVDRQVKIRGFRIEPEEIEAVLRRHPGIRRAAVDVDRERAGSERLLAWYTGVEGEAPGEVEVRAWLRDRVPAHLVPAGLRRLPELPLTPAGKVDRRALAALAPAPERVSAPYVAPQDATEQALAEIWRDVLGRADIGTRQNFFDLGGHSLLLVRVQTMCRERMGHEVDLVDLFGHPTIAAQARLLDRPDNGARAGDAALDATHERALRQRRNRARRPTDAHAPGREL